MRINHLFLLFFILACTNSSDRFLLESPKGGPFVIQTTEGLLNSEQLIGKQVFLFFGFINCPDICPLTLNRMKQVADQLNDQEKSNFRFLFISVDNERDTLEKLKDLKKDYGEQFIGAVDSDKSLSKIVKSFGARYQRFKNQRGAPVIDHTDSIFHLNSEGEWINTISYGTSVDDMLTLLRTDKSNRVDTHIASRELIKLAEQSRCDLAKETCEINYNDHKFTLKFSPYPIRTEKKFSATLTLESSEYTPIELDFEGVDLNMGLIRPKLIALENETAFSTEVRLPICELEAMNWIVRLIVKDSKEQQSFLQFSFITTD